MEEGVHNIVMFFGSARAKSRKDWDTAMEEAKTPADQEKLKKTEFLVQHYENVRELTKRFTQWSTERAKAGKMMHVVGTGGGPGMMQAANEGKCAFEV